jgi:hypothetical protein
VNQQPKFDHPHPKFDPPQGNPHSHLFTIADEEAFDTLVAKLVKSGLSQPNREKVLEALQTAVEEFKTTNDNERKAFFHGLLAGYSVGLKLQQQGSK